MMVVDTGDDMTLLHTCSAPGQSPGRDLVRQLRETYPREREEEGQLSGLSSWTAKQGCSPPSSGQKQCKEVKALFRRQMPCWCPPVGL